MKIYHHKLIAAKYLLFALVFILSGCSFNKSYTGNSQHENSNEEASLMGNGQHENSNEAASLMGNLPVNEDQKLQKREYTIEERDVLHISVWREDDLREDVIVRPDGRISFPLAGDVQAVGLTFGELKLEITERLKVFIKEPEVSISLKKSAGRKIIILGEVSSAGVYSVTGRMTVLEAIALASGFTEDAVTNSVIHIRRGQQKPLGTRLDLSYALKHSDVSQNITLQSEDIIYVPKKFIADVNYFTRQIITPIAQGIWAIKGFQSLDE
jgi:polysaccharide export outer membrane protein